MSWPYSGNFVGRSGADIPTMMGALALAAQERAAAVDGSDVGAEPADITPPALYIDDAGTTSTTATAADFAGMRIHGQKLYDNLDILSDWIATSASTFTETATGARWTSAALFAAISYDPLAPYSIFSAWKWTALKDAMDLLIYVKEIKALPGANVGDSITGVGSVPAVDTVQDAWDEAIADLADHGEPGAGVGMQAQIGAVTHDAEIVSETTSIPLPVFLDFGDVSLAEVDMVLTGQNYIASSAAWQIAGASAEDFGGGATHVDVDVTGFFVLGTATEIDISIVSIPASPPFDDLEIQPGSAFANVFAVNVWRDLSAYLTDQA